MMNIDPHELKKFSDLSQQWWDLQGPMKTLHSINRARMTFILSSITSQKQILDIGCGGGILSESLAQVGHHVTGLDPSQSLIQVAQQHAPKELSLQYHAGSIENHPKKQHYDCVTCMELLEHVPSPDALIAACASQIKSDGKLFISTINRNLKSYLMAILGAEYVLKLLPKHTHHYENFIKPSELDPWLRANGLFIRRISGIQYNPFTNQAHLSTDVSVNYILECQKSSEDIKATQ